MDRYNPDDVRILIYPLNFSQLQTLSSDLEAMILVDDLAVGRRELLGNPKRPSVFVYQLDQNGEYQVNRFQGSEQMVSPTVPTLSLTIEQITRV